MHCTRRACEARSMACRPEAHRMCCVSVRHLLRGRAQGGAEEAEDEQEEQEQQDDDQAEEAEEEEEEEAPAAEGTPGEEVRAGQMLKMALIQSALTHSVLKNIRSALDMT